MAIKEVRKPYIGEFGGHTFVESNGYLVCAEKDVKVSIPILRSTMKDINKYPKETKIAVGLTITGNKIVNMWRDDFNTHIECLSEPTKEFNKKYQKLIKHLNGK